VLFTRKYQRTIFVGNFMENIFGWNIFLLEMRYFWEERKKLIFGRFKPPKNQLPEVVGGGGVRFFLGNQRITINNFQQWNPWWEFFFFKTSVSALHFVGNDGTLVKKSCLDVRNNILRIPPLTPVLSALLPPPQMPPYQFFANISQSMRPREKIEEAENAPHEISYRIGHSRVSLCLPISLKIHSNGYKPRFLLFFTF